MKTKLILTFLLGIIFFGVNNVFAAAISSNGTGGGNWSDGTATGPWFPSAVPGAGDDVTIVDGDVVTVDVSVTCNSLTIQSDGSAIGFATLTIDAFTLTVTGNIDLSSINTGGASTIETKANSAVSILNAQSDINLNAFDGAETPTLDIKNKSTLNISGNINLNSTNPTTTFGTTSIVNYNGAGSQTIIAAQYGTVQSSSTGARILDPNGSILIKGNTTTCFVPGTNAYTITGSSMEFSGGGNQTIPAFDFNDLKIGSLGTKTFAAGTIGVAGTLSFLGTNLYSVTGNTFNFNGPASPQNIPMRTTLTYNNITVNNAGATGAVLISNNITSTNVTGSITVESGIFNNGAFAIAGNAGQTFQVNNGATFTLITNTGMPTGFGTTTLQPTSTVKFDGNAGQSIPAINFGNLTFSNSGTRTLASSGTIGVSGTFDPGSNSCTITGSTIDFNGSGAQGIPAFNYNNLTSSSTGGRTLAAAGTIGVEETFTPGTNAYTITGSTMDFNGSGAQTIPAFNYNNLTISNARTTNSVTLVNGGTIGIAGTFNPTATFTSGAYVIANNTIDFNGTGAQTIPTFNYTNLAISNARTTNSITLVNGGTIGVAGTFNPTATFTSGAYVITNNTIDFNGSGAQTIPAFNYNNLTSSSTGGRTLAAAGTVGIAGVFTVGTNAYTTTGSTVNFNAAGAQTIPVLTSPADYINITVSGSGTKSLAGNMNLIGTLVISAGTLDVNGHVFTLISTAAGTARIAAIPGGSGVTGNITMQRYVSDATTEWRSIGASVDEATLTIQDWANDFATSGFPGSTDPSNSFVSIQWYDESIPGDLDANGYTPATNVTNAIVKGRGYFVYLGPTPTTFNVTGAPYQQEIPLPVTCILPAYDATNDGWNLVSNPYPCTIDWDDVANWTKTNMGAQIHVYNPSQQNYADWTTGVGAGVNGGSPYIASSQAFWVQADGAGAPELKVRESAKVPNQDPALLKIEITPNTSRCPMAFTDFPIPLNSTSPGLLRLTASGNGHNDELLLAFKQGATNNFDGYFDASKLSNDASTHNFSSVIAGDQDLSINAMPPLTSDVHIPLRLTIPTCSCTATYSIRRDSILMLPTSSCIILEDKKTGSMINLQTTVSYSFTISDTTQAPRFVLHIYAPLTKQAVSASCSNSSNGKAIAKGTGTGPWNYVWKNSVGTIVKTTTGSTSADTLLNCAAGTYSVSVNSAICGTVTDTIIVKAPAAIANTASHTNVSCFGGNNGSATVVPTGGTPGYSYVWSNGQSTSLASNLSFGNYSVTVTDSKGCTSTSSVTITQPALLTAGYTASSYTVDIALGSNVTFTNTSLGASTYKWNFGDGSGINVSVNPTHSYSLTGSYTVTLISYNTSCSDTTHSTIVVINSNPTGLNENQSAAGINVAYDNGQVFLVFSLNQETKVNISVYNMLGEELFSQNNLLVKNERVKLDFSSTAIGIYIAVSEMKDAIVSKKIFIPARSLSHQ